MGTTSVPTNMGPQDQMASRLFVPEKEGTGNLVLKKKKETNKRT
uniref:Uncharacterized protein n=1 Tax=Arundo donax TaxID=35708 RepID=A0A0A9H4J0_ARUDO